MLTTPTTSSPANQLKLQLERNKERLRNSHQETNKPSRSSWAKPVMKHLTDEVEVHRQGWFFVILACHYPVPDGFDQLSSIFLHCPDSKLCTPVYESQQHQEITKILRNLRIEPADATGQEARMPFTMFVNLNRPRLAPCTWDDFLLIEEAKICCNTSQFFKDCPGGGELRILWFFIYFLSQLYRLKPLGYCSPTCAT